MSFVSNGRHMTVEVQLIVNNNSKITCSFCLSFYDVALWTLLHKNCLYKFECCYNKCVKLFFGNRKYDSVTNELFETGLPSFDTVLHTGNANCVFQSRWNFARTL